MKPSIFALLFCVLALAACTATGVAMIDRFIPPEGDPDDFRNRTYYAADELARQLVRELPAQVPMYAGTFRLVNTGRASVAPDAPFDDMTLRYVSSRLVQRGFSVGSAGASLPVSEAYKGSFGRIVLGGDYLISASDILVHLEVTDAGSGRILAAHDYSVPLDEEVKSYLRSPAQNAPRPRSTVAMQKLPAPAVAPAPGVVRATPLSPGGSRPIIQ